MHQVITVIVYAENKNEALDKAKTIFERLCENQYPFDYFTTFDEDGIGTSGKDRWGNLPAVTLAISKKGKELIEQGIKFTKDEFMENLKIIRKLLKKKTDKELFEKDGGVEMFRFSCYQIGRHRGSSVWLYDNDGEGITDPEHLKNVLKKWNDKSYRGLKIYVVPADVHY